MISYFPALLDLKTVCDELGSVEHKSHKIGVMLGIPQHKLLKFQKGDNPLPAIADFWLHGNVEEAEVSWKSIATALASGFVGEPALAKKISQKYCQVEESQKGIAMIHELAIYIRDWYRKGIPPPPPILSPFSEQILGH